MQTVVSILEGIAHDVKDHTDKERKTIVSLKNLADSTLSSEVSSLLETSNDWKEELNSPSGFSIAAPK